MKKDSHYIVDFDDKSHSSTKISIHRVCLKYTHITSFELFFETLLNDNFFRLFLSDLKISNRNLLFEKNFILINFSIGVVYTDNSVHLLLQLFYFLYLFMSAIVNIQHNQQKTFHMKIIEK
jgi:hypothetical protein